MSAASHHPITKKVGRIWLIFIHQVVIFYMIMLTYVMWSSKMSRNSQILFLRYSQTKPIVSVAFYCLFNPSNVCIFGTNCPESLNNTLIENAKKLQIIFFDFRLILLDRITYNNITQGSHPGCVTRSCHRSVSICYIHTSTDLLHFNLLPQEIKIGWNSKSKCYLYQQC